MYIHMYAHTYVHTNTQTHTQEKMEAYAEQQRRLLKAEDTKERAEMRQKAARSKAYRSQAKKNYLVKYFHVSGE